MKNKILSIIFLFIFTSQIYAQIDFKPVGVSPPDLDSTYSTSHFEIKYSLVTDDTLNGIPATDNNNDGVPDFINYVAQTVEDVYEKFFETAYYRHYMKFHKPPYPYGYGYNVYIFNIGIDAGLTAPFHFVGDNPLTDSLVEKNSVSSLLYLNNKIDDVIQQQFTLEQKIKVTIVHEFFHVIQYGYDGYLSPWLMEATATWAETHIYPDIKMNRTYVADFIKNCSVPLNVNGNDNLPVNCRQHWYSDWIFFQYMYEHEDNDIIRWIFYHTVLNHNAAYDSTDVSIKSINDALDLSLYSNDFGTEFHQFAVANYVKNVYPYDYGDTTLIPDFQSSWYTNIFSDSYSQTFDIQRLGINYHKVAVSHLSNNPIKIIFSEPSDDSIKANVVSISNNQKHIHRLDKYNSVTLNNPSSIDELVFIVTNSSQYNRQSPLGGTEPKSYDLNIEMDASLTKIRDFKNTNVSNIYNFACNEEALLWIEEDGYYGDLTPVYFTGKFHSYGLKERDVFWQNPEAMLSNLSINDDEFVYAYHKYANFYADDSLIVWAVSDKFDYSVPVLKQRISYPADPGIILWLGIDNKKVYYDVALSNFQKDNYDIWKYDLITKQKVKITDNGQGPSSGLGSGPNESFIVNKNYCVWSRYNQLNDNKESMDIWLYDDDTGSLKNIFNSMGLQVDIYSLDVADDYVVWTYRTIPDSIQYNALMIYNLETNTLEDSIVNNYNWQVKTKNGYVVYKDASEKNFIIWNKGNIKSIQSSAPINGDFFVGNNSIGWYEVINDGSGVKLSFYSADITSGKIKSYTTETYPTPQIIVLGYNNGIFYYEKTDGVFPEGIYKLNFNSEYFSRGGGSQSNPTNFKLYNNYPNPFNPSTNIKFYIPQDDKVVIKIYDILGREIQTLVNSEFTAGDHVVVFTTNSLASGVYFYQMKAGNFVEAKKMILLK